jgi:O-antigen/teichoic acid export membrane protein
VNRTEALSAFLWSSAERWGYRIFSLITFAVLARLLAPAEIGVVAFAAVFVELSRVILDQGVARCLIQEAEEDPRLQTAAATVSLGTGAALGMVLFALSFWTRLWPANVPQILRWMLVIVVLTSIESVPKALLERRLQFRALTIRRTIATAIGNATSIASAALGLGAMSIVVGQIVSGLIALALTLKQAKLVWGPVHRQSFQTVGRRSRGLLSIEIGSYVAGQGDSFVIGILLGTEALGIYSVAFRIWQVVAELFTVSISNVGLPILARLRHQLPEFRSSYLIALKALSLVGAPAYFLLAVLAPAAVRLYVGPTWTAAVPPLVLLALMGAVSSLTYLDRGALLALDLTGWESTFTWVVAFVGIPFVLIGSRGGIAGVAASVGLRALLTTPPRIWMVCRAMRLGVGDHLRAWLPSFIVAGSASAAIWAGLRPFELGPVTNAAATTGIFLVGYAAFAYWFARRAPALIGRRRSRTATAPSVGTTFQEVMEVK